MIRPADNSDREASDPPAIPDWRFFVLPCISMTLLAVLSFACVDWDRVQSGFHRLTGKPANTDSPDP